MDGSGEAYVADTGNNRIVKLSPTGRRCTDWGSRGTGDGRFRSPTGVAVDAAGTVYVLDSENNRVQAFDGNGRLLAKWGLRGAGLGEFSQPTAVAVDCNGVVYVADTNNNRVERFDMPTPAGGELPGAGSLAAAARRGTRATDQPAAILRRARAARARAGGELPARLQGPRQRDARPGRAAGLGAAGPGRPLAPPQRSRATCGCGWVPAPCVGCARPLGARSADDARGSTILAAGPTGRRTTLVRSYIVGALGSIMQPMSDEEPFAADPRGDGLAARSGSGSRPSGFASRECSRLRATASAAGSPTS